MKLLILFLLLSLASGNYISLYVAGNVTGIGYNESYIDAPGANVTGNNSSLLFLWEDDIYGNRQNTPL